MLGRGRVAVVVAVVVVVGGLVGWITFGHSSSSSTGTATTSTTPVTTSPGGTAPATAFSGWLHTSGTTVVDSTGQAVHLTGLNVTGMESSNPQGTNVPGTCNNGWKELTRAEVDTIAGYGFTTVRLPIAWANLEPTAPTVAPNGSLVHTWNGAYVAALDSEMQLFAAHQIHVILDMHQATWSYQFQTTGTNARPGCPGSGMPGWINPSAINETANHARCSFLADRTEPGVPGTDWTDFEAAWSFLGAHFANVPTVVGLDLLNEPSCQTVGLDAFYGAVAPAVHASDPNALIVLEDKEQPGTYQLTQMPAVANAVLSIHLHEDYWSTPSSGQTAQPYSASAVMAANVARSSRWNVPLYVGEFYAFDAASVQEKGKNQRDANFVADTASFLQYSRAHGIGWTYWAWIAQKNYANQVSLPPAVKAALTQG